MQGISVPQAQSFDIPQVQNVSALTINGSASDLIINLSGTNVKFPMLGEVVLSENQ